MNLAKIQRENNPLGLPYSTIKIRMKKGWGLEKTLHTPYRPKVLGKYQKEYLDFIERNIYVACDMKTYCYRRSNRCSIATSMK